jgi:hypothetical protein
MMYRDEELGRILGAKRPDMTALGQVLDEMSHAQRVLNLERFSPKIQRRVFEAAQGRPVRLEDIVPDGKGPLEEVIHQGINTLPSFRSFQKRFCLPTGAHANPARAEVWGYNHQTMSTFTGPGYFVGYEDTSNGEFCIDYTMLPPERPGAWPRVVSNKRKLGLVVYAGMVDRLRKVSEHVTIGRAYKLGVPMNAYFVLVRASA